MRVGLLVALSLIFSSVVWGQTYVGPNIEVYVDEVSGTNPEVSKYCLYAYQSEGAYVLKSVNPTTNDLVACQDADANQTETVLIADPSTLGLAEGQSIYLAATTVDDAGNEGAVGQETLVTWKSINPVVSDVKLRMIIEFTSP